jgi:adenosylcobinamide-phosphate synthase
MTRAQTIAAAYLLDWIAGDPEWFPHPVRLMGQCSQLGEALLRRPGQSANDELVAGGALTVAMVGVFYLGTARAIEWAYRIGCGTGFVTEFLLGWTCLASRGLVDEANAVIRALEHEDLPRARQRLARIVGRDTQALSTTEIHRAVIETLAESACDGIVAPLFYMAIGGVPLAMAYKAINTLDSMIGHADQRYFYFGKAAARLDDVANYLPSRLTALAIATAAGREAMRAGGPPCAYGGVMAENTRAPTQASPRVQWPAPCASGWVARIPTRVSASLEGYGLQPVHKGSKNNGL